MGSKSQQPAARLGDIASNHGPWPPTPIIGGSPDTFINGIPAARQGDPVLLHSIPNNPPHARSLTEGSPSVLINGKPAARVSDAISCGGKVSNGSPNVLIGDNPQLDEPASNPPPTNTTDSALAAAKQDAIDTWQRQKDKAEHFPEFLAAHLMMLNAEAGYSIAEGLTATFETVTDADKFKAAMGQLKDSAIDTVTDPVKTYHQVKMAAVDFSNLPLSEQGDAAYKAMVAALAGGAASKAGGVMVKAVKRGKNSQPDSHSHPTKHNLPPLPQSMEEVLSRMVVATEKVQRARANGTELPMSPFTLEDKLRIVEEGLEEKYIVRVIKTDYNKDNGSIGWVNDNGRSNYWTTTYTQLEYADRDAELITKAVGIDYHPNTDYTLLVIDVEQAALKGDISTFIPTYDRIGTLAKTEMNDVNPALIDKVMTPEYSDVYAELVTKAKHDGVDLNKSRELKELSKKLQLSPEEVESLIIRQKINKNYGANDQFLGIGLAKDVSAADGLGIVETYSLDKKPGTLGDLERDNIIKRIPLTSY